jgi:hypothetical protein
LEILTKAHNMLIYKCAINIVIRIEPPIMSSKRTHIVISDQLVKEIDTLVGKRGRSSFLTQAAWREVKRLRMLSALEGATGAWKDKDHPELKEGSAKWIESMRQEGEKRLQKVTKR